MVEAPEPRIAATTLFGLWRSQSPSRQPPGGVRKAMFADVRRATTLPDAGLRTFGASGTKGPLMVETPRRTRYDWGTTVLGGRGSLEGVN